MGHDLIQYSPLLVADDIILVSLMCAQDFEMLTCLEFTCYYCLKSCHLRDSIPSFNYFTSLYPSRVQSSLVTMVSAVCVCVGGVV